MARLLKKRKLDELKLEGPEIQPSDEQLRILEHFHQGYNITCDAVAGGAKSTTLMLLIQRNPQLKFLGLSYNNSLVSSANDKLEVAGVQSVSRFYTYHTAMQTFYDISEIVCDDFVFETWLEKIESKSVAIRQSLGQFEVLLIDEVQDMRYPYYRLVMCLLVQCLPPTVQIVAVGASDQVLYDFFHLNPADNRFLLCLPELLKGVNDRKWAVLRLSQSFRLSPSVAGLVNHLQKRDYITGVNPTDPPIDYWICDVFSLLLVIKLHKDVLVPNLHNRVVLLFPSVNSRMCRFIVNQLYLRYQTQFDFGTAHTSAPVVRVATYHAFKGLEAEVVVVFGLHSQNYQGAELLDPLNVALTRTKGKMYLIHYFQDPYAPYFGAAFHLCNIQVFRGHPYLPRNHSKNSDKRRTFLDLDGLCRFLEPQQVKGLLSQLEWKQSDLPSNEDGATTTPPLLVKDPTDQHKLLFVLKLEQAVFKGFPSLRRLLEKKIKLPFKYSTRLKKLALLTCPSREDYLELTRLLSADGGFYTHLQSSSLRMKELGGYDPDVRPFLGLAVKSFSDTRNFKHEGVTYRSQVDALLAEQVPILVTYKTNDPLAQLKLAMHAAIRSSCIGKLLQLDTNTVCTITVPPTFIASVQQLSQTRTHTSIDKDSFLAQALTPFGQSGC